MARDSKTDATAGGDARSEPRRRARPVAIWAVLVAVIVGAVTVGATLFATGGFEPDVEEHAPRLAASGTTLAKSTPGTCLTWEGAAPTNITPIDCGQPHKFEVAGPPARTLPQEAKYPTEPEIAALREQLCPPVVTQYIGRQLDPRGRYQQGLLIAGESAWNQGDRTMRCGMQTVDGAGAVVMTSGKIVNQEKSTAWPPGTCIGIDGAGAATAPVDCAQPHAFEVTALIDLRRPFPAASWPTLGQQEDFLGRQCPSATVNWFGAQDGLRKSGLQLQWNTMSQPSWTAGARNVICFVASSRDGRSYTPLTGSAKSPDLLIDGKKPVLPTFPGVPAPTPGG